VRTISILPKILCLVNNGVIFEMGEVMMFVGGETMGKITMMVEDYQTLGGFS
jgi:hypothetical protein